VSSPIPVPDDATVPRISSTKGWTVRRALRIEVFVAPDGVEYVLAHRLEPADLIRDFGPGTRPWRLVLREGSSAERGEERLRNLAAGRTRRQRARRK
jgi:hypothetical protein